MRRIHRTLDWLAAHPLAVDAVWVALAWPFVWSLLATGSSMRSPSGLLVGLWALGYLVPLAWRRVDADAAALGIIPAHLVQLALTSTPNVGNVAVPIALYAVARYGRERWSRAWLLVGLGASVVAAARWVAGSAFAGPTSAAQVLFGVTALVIGMGGVVSASWFMGMLARTRRSSVTAWRERAEALERERDQASRLAAAEERQRIAREMHDIVAHSLSVIVVQADGGAYAAGQPGDAEARLATAAQALETIRGTARTALGETRRLVGVLRTGEGAERAPSASLADVDALVAQVRASGLAVSLERHGDAAAHRPLASGAELAGYRVVQEALTNVMKHAGPAASARVMIAHDASGVTVGVRDDGRGATATDGAGHGLVGMRERVAAYGGTLRAGPRFDGGFEVVAHLPAPDQEHR